MLDRLGIRLLFKLLRPRGVTVGNQPTGQASALAVHTNFRFSWCPHP
jgi:hypothetical protein